MKILNIIRKDLSQSFRSAAAVIFMIGVPILVVVMFYFMLGRINNENNFELPKTSVQIVNLDQGHPTFTQSLSMGAPDALVQMGIDPGSIHSMGDILVQLLDSESFATILDITPAQDATAARSAVDDQQAGVALIIPENFTQAVMESEETAVIELYQDPTLSLGPGIVKAILSQFLDYSSATKIGMQVVNMQLEEAGLNVEGNQQQIAMQFLSAGSETPQADELVVLQALTEEEQRNPMAKIMGLYMGAMMIFYAFYTGTITAQSILTEEQRGTLQRLFTTPTPLWTILGGKFASTLLTVTIQVIALLIFSSLVFGVEWGKPLMVALSALGIIISASSFGIFIISLLKNIKQTGAVMGGVLTTTGMMGIISVFTMNLASGNNLAKTMSLLVPQGWAMNALSMAIDGAPIHDVLPVLGGVLVWSTVFMIIGLLRFHKRFA